MLTGHASRPASIRSIAHGGSSKPAVMSVVTPPDRAAGSSSGLIEVDVGVDRARASRSGRSPCTACVCGPMTRSMPSLIAGLPGAPDTDDPAVLDPDVGLDDADDRIEHEHAGDDDVQLRRARAGPCAIRCADRLGVAPDRLVAGRLAVLGDLHPQVRVARGARGRRWWRRSGRGARPGRAARVTGRRLVAARGTGRAGRCCVSPGSQRIVRAGRAGRGGSPRPPSRSKTSRGFTRWNG